MSLRGANSQFQYRSQDIYSISCSPNHKSPFVIIIASFYIYANLLYLFFLPLEALHFQAVMEIYA